MKDVEKDLRKLKIALTHEEITSMSKYMLKNLVRKKRDHLLDIKLSEGGGGVLTIFQKFC